MREVNPRGAWVWVHALLLEVVLAAATRCAAGERARVVSLTSVHTRRSLLVLVLLLLFGVADRW